MKSISIIFLFFAALVSLRAHEIVGNGPASVHMEPSSRQISSSRSGSEAQARPDDSSRKPPQAASFAMFAPAVRTRWDDAYLYIESNGLPAHDMMVGITAWQQQLPLPQNYRAENAWRLPLFPVPAKQGVSIRNRFLRGAIAIAANGVPIFNPQNNRGEISLDIGELDKWGGHCGRADDYHYHVAPLHLQKTTGPRLPIAYAMDGYPILGLTEPDGTLPANLDGFHGHSHSELGYHYHASSSYPFVMGGFHGEVVERDGQVDPQPRATPVRESLPALKGAAITGFQKVGEQGCKVTYAVDGEERTVAVTQGADGNSRFVFNDGRTESVTEVRAPRPKPGRDAPARREGTVHAAGAEPPRSSDGTFRLSSPVVEDMGELPARFTGQGLGISPPLVWTGAPKNTAAFALIMDHIDPEGQPKWYWILHGIPGSCTSLKEDSGDVGKPGTGFRGRIGYEPPMSKGPGARTYVITLFALSAPLAPGLPESVDRDALLAAIKGRVLASSSLRVIHTSAGGAERPRGPGGSPDQGLPKIPSRRSPELSDPRMRQDDGSSSWIKPTFDDTMKLRVYADNWFMPLSSRKRT